jgi:predicted MFS family arabinose efflux permease
MTIALAGLAALAVAMGIGRFAFTPLLPMMQADAGLTLAGGGWLASANYAGYLAGALSAPLASSTLAIRGGLIAIALATLAMALDRHFLSWFVLRAVAGVASAWVLVHVSSYCLQRLASLGRPQLAGVLYTGVGAGIAAAGLLCLAFMALALPSRHAWLALGVLSLALGMALWPVFGQHAAVPPANVRAAWTWEKAKLVLCYGAFGFGYIIPATFIPAMARELIDRPAIFGWAWPAFGAAAAVSTLIAPRLMKDNRRLWAWAQLVMAFAVAAPLFIGGIGGILLAAVCIGGTFMVITMVAMQEALRIAAPNGARLMGAMTASFATGQILGPVLVSLLVERGAPLAAALVTASVLLAASAFALMKAKP